MLVIKQTNSSIIHLFQLIFIPTQLQIYFLLLSADFLYPLLEKILRWIHQFLSQKVLQQILGIKVLFQMIFSKHIRNTFSISYQQNRRIYIYAHLSQLSIYNYQKFKNMIEEGIDDFGIEKKFMNIQKYKITAQKSKRRNVLNENYLEILEKIYKQYQRFSENTHDLFKIRQNEKSIYLKEFKGFLNEIVQTLKETSIFQIGCITQAQISRDQNVDLAIEDVQNQLPKYSQAQQIVLKQLSELASLKSEVKRLYESFTVEYQNPYTFYNKDKMLSRKQNLQGKMKKIINFEKKLDENKKEIKTNIHGFEKLLQIFRKKLFNNKYIMLNKMKQTSKHSCQCLTQILMLLTKIINVKIVSFKKLVSNAQSDDSLLSNNKIRHQKYEDEGQTIISINNSVREYSAVIDEVDNILKGLDEQMKKLSLGVRQVIEQDKINITQFINEVYQVQENPSSEVIDTFDLFLYFTNKFSSVSDKIYQASKNLYTLKNNVKKHSDVIISFRRSSLNNKIKSQQENMSEKSERLDLFYEQISYDYIIEIIMSVYESFKGQIEDLNDYFAKKFYKKRNQTQDSMQLSYLEETVISIQKKPCKHELWLWKDWKNHNSLYFENSLGLFQKMKQMFQKIIQQPQKPEIQKFQCTLAGKKDLKGILRLRQTYLQFQSLSSTHGDNISLIIPLREVLQVGVKVRAFGRKELIGLTNKGEVSFVNFINIKEASNQIKEKLENTGNNQVAKRRKQVILSTEEISAIEARKIQVEKERVRLDDTWEKIETIEMSGIRIDQVYQHIYSDKEFILRGKPEKTFMAYMMKKAGNINYVTNPYDKSGPEFYTQQTKVTFSNCPIYSSRENDFDHPLPKIPFMPKICHVHEKCRLYWINHEEFDYSVISQTSGAPSTDTFYVRILHRVRQKQNSIIIETYGSTVFVKNSALKGMLKSKSEQELRTGLKETCAEIEKSLRILLAPASESGLNESRISNQSFVEPEQTDEVSKLKNQNKLLIVILISVVILNALIQFIF